VNIGLCGFSYQGLTQLQSRRQGRHEAWWRIRASLRSGSFPEEGPRLLADHDPAGMGWRWLQSDPAESGGWPRHEPPHSWLRVPMLLIGGWFDPHLRGVLDLATRSLATGGCPQLLIGPLSHLHSEIGAAAHWNMGSEAASVVDRHQAAFFDRHLKGRQPVAGEPRPQPGGLDSGRVFDLGSLRWQPLSRAGLDTGRRWPSRIEQ